MNYLPGNVKDKIDELHSAKTKMGIGWMVYYIL